MVNSNIIKEVLDHEMKILFTIRQMKYKYQRLELYEIVYTIRIKDQLVSSKSVKNLRKRFCSTATI